METVVQALTAVGRGFQVSFAVTLVVAALISVAVRPAYGQSSRPDAPEAARIMSAGDKAFRAGQVDAATATFRTLKNFFPGWWIPAAKLVVARRQAGMKIGTVITGLEYIVDLDPTGPYLPMLLALAAGERLAPEDIEHLAKLHRAEIAKPVEDPDFATLRNAGDLESRYRFARAVSLEAAGLAPEAEAEYRRLIELRPFALAPKARLARLLRELGRNDEAAAVMRGAEGSSLFPARIKVLSGQRAGVRR